MLVRLLTRRGAVRWVRFAARRAPGGAPGTSPREPFDTTAQPWPPDSPEEVLAARERGLPPA